MKTIQIRLAGHWWRSRDELISDVLLWNPSHGWAKARRPAQTYIQQLCEDMGCSPEDLPEAMNDRERWRERVRDTHANGTTWWWWNIKIYINASRTYFIQIFIFHHDLVNAVILPCKQDLQYVGCVPHWEIRPSDKRSYPSMMINPISGAFESMKYPFIVINSWSGVKYLLGSHVWSKWPVCKLSVLDKNTWNHLNVCKKLFRNYTRNVNINIKWM